MFTVNSRESLAQNLKGLFANGQFKTVPAKVLGYDYPRVFTVMKIRNLTKQRSPFPDKVHKVLEMKVFIPGIKMYQKTEKRVVLFFRVKLVLNKKDADDKNI